MFLVNSVWSQQHNRDDMRDMLLEDLEIAMKVVIVGNGSVGKSSMIQRFCRGIFTRDYKKTIGVDFLERILPIEDQSVRLMLWDTAGQEEFDAITRTYYRGANACVLACSVTDKESFLALPKWKNKVCRECGDIPMVLVANKVDLQKQAVVDSAELEAMARSLGITKLYKTSVKEDMNVNAVFNHLAQQYVQLVMNEAAEDEDDDLGPTDDDSAHLHHINSPLFSNNKSSKANKPPKNSSKTPNNNKSLFRNPVILKSNSQTANGNGVVGNNGNNNPSRGFFASALGVKSKISNNNNHNQQLLHHNSSNIKSSVSHLTNNSNGQIVHHHMPHHHYSAYTNGYGGGGVGLTSNRWNDTMPFRLDIVKGKKRRRESCNIL